MIRLFLLLVCCHVLIGCGVRAPQSQYTASTITQSTPEAVAMEVEFDVSNSNDEPLHLTMFDYTVTVDGRAVYSGKHSAQQTVPRLKRVYCKVPVVIRRNQILGTQNLKWKLSGTLGYIPPTEFAETLLKSGFWKPTTHIRAHGSLPIPPID